MVLDGVQATDFVPATYSQAQIHEIDPYAAPWGTSLEWGTYGFPENIYSYV